MRIPLLFLLSFSMMPLPALQAQLTPRTPPSPAAPSAGPAAPRPLKDEDLDKLIAQLADIESILQGKRSSYNNSLLGQLKDAAASEEKAFALWLEGTKEQEFDDKGKSLGDFMDWKRIKFKELHNVPFMTALRLQVRFLSVLIQYSNAQSDSARGEAITLVVGYLDDLAASAKKLDGNMDELNRQVLETVIAKHLKLDSSLPRIKNGAYHPANLQEIYERMILPYYRENKQISNLMTAWQKLISQETIMVEAAKIPEKVTIFQQERLPELKWGQAREMYEAGQEEPATTAMLAVIKGNLGHKRAGAWIGELSETLKARRERSAAGVPAAGSKTPPPLPVKNAAAP